MRMPFRPANTRVDDHVRDLDYLPPPPPHLARHLDHHLDRHLDHHLDRHLDHHLDRRHERTGGALEITGLLPTIAPMIPTGLPSKGWAGGRDAQSMAFFRTPGME